jgi:16S rRNA processing protein RimM
MVYKRSDRVLVGRISGVFGVEGWIKVYSYTEPRENVVNYSPWRLLGRDGELVREVLAGRRHGNGVVAKLQAIDDRDAAAALVGVDIQLCREQLETLSAGEYYWADLVGLEVVDLEGKTLGTVSQLLRTGANDVLVVEGDRERLIPFVQGAIVTDIDLDAGRMRVDWAPDY